MKAENEAEEDDEEMKHIQTHMLAQLIVVARCFGRYRVVPSMVTIIITA